MQTQIADIIVPAQFTAYQVENSVVSTKFFQSGVVAKNGLIADQLAAGATSFTVPFWKDIPDVEADITNDDPYHPVSIPQKITAGKQTVRKSFLHGSWSEMSLAAELAGSSALARVQSRVQAYWDRQMEQRLIASLRGILASNVANNGSDMVNDISQLSGNWHYRQPWTLLLSGSSDRHGADARRPSGGLCRHRHALLHLRERAERRPHHVCSEFARHVSWCRHTGAWRYSLTIVSRQQTATTPQSCSVTALSATVHPLPTLDMGRKCIALPLPVTAVDRRHFIAA